VAAQGPDIEDPCGLHPAAVRYNPIKA
jgi:hypothetical protein